MKPIVATTLSVAGVLAAAALALAANMAVFSGPSEATVPDVTPATAEPATGSGTVSQDDDSSEGVERRATVGDDDHVEYENEGIGHGDDD